MKVKLIYIIVFISLSVTTYYIFNYSEYSRNIQKVLSKSNSNEKELLKVLEHYKSIPKDSLKYKAASYLISNMEWKFSKLKLTTEPIKYKNLFKKIDSLVQTPFLLFTDEELKKQKIERIKLKKKKLNRRKLNKKKWVPKKKYVPIYYYIKDSLEKLTKNEISSYSTDTIVYDYNSINSDYLINHIDKAFKNWRNSKNANSMGFNEFCETLLPYRYMSEILNYSEKYTSTFKNNDTSKNLKEKIYDFNTYLSNIRDLVKDVKFKNELGFYNILKYNTTDCFEHSLIATHILNTIGIPTVIDFTPQWKHKPGRHSWCRSRDIDGKYYAFTPQWQNINDSLPLYFKKATKVYRYTFLENVNSPIVLKKTKEDIPSIFNRSNIKDVTNEYFDVVNLKIPIKEISKSNNLGYLAVFRNDGWNPVAWGMLNTKNKEIVFNKVPTEVTYCPGYFLNNEFVPISNPFYLDKDGKKNQLNPDINSTRKITLMRKYPLKNEFHKWVEFIKRGKIQGSNTSNFSNAIDLYQFQEYPKPYTVEINIEESNRKFKYLRFLPFKKKSSNVAILEFYKYSTTKITEGTMPYIFDEKDSIKYKNLNLKKLIGNSIKTRRKKIATNIEEKAFDGNIETFSRKKWIGIELEKPSAVSKIRFAPKNANNMINIGDDYELLFFDKTWKSLGIKKAKYNFLTYDNAPLNAVFWLKNLTKGKEELCFMYKNGKQFFVNHDNIEEVLNN